MCVCVCKCLRRRRRQQRIARAESLRCVSVSACACVHARRSVRIIVSATGALIAMRARFIFSITPAAETHERTLCASVSVRLCARCKWENVRSFSHLMCEM